MKIRAPTRVIMTSIAAVSGSKTQPSRTVVSPSENHSKLRTSRGPGWASVSIKAAPAMKKLSAIEPMANPAARERWDCFAKAVTPAASSGNSGTHQRFAPIEFTHALIRVGAGPEHRLTVPFIEVDRFPHFGEFEVLPPLEESYIALGFQGALDRPGRGFAAHGQGFRQHPSVHGLRRLNAQQPEDGRRHVDVPAGHLVDHPLLEVRPGRH